MTLSSWYFGSEPVYFNIYYTDSKESKLQRLKIVIKPDLSDASLHVINVSEIVSDDLKNALKLYRFEKKLQICENALVYTWNYPDAWEAYVGLTSASFTNFLTRWDGRVRSLCPTSGRSVCRDFEGDFFNDRILVADLF